MKRLLQMLLLLGLLSGFHASAQNTFHLSGVVLDSAGNPVPNFPALVYVGTSSGLNIQGISSNFLGLIDATIHLDSGLTSATSVDVVYTSCNNPSANFTAILGPVNANDTLSFAIITDCGSTGACVSAFTYQASGDTVQFTDNSNGGSNLQYFWDFGDGSPISTTANPLHEYPGPGTYYACLTIQDSLSNCFNTSCETIIIGGSGTCVASFLTQNQGLNVDFISTSSIGNPMFSGVNSWDFGDGSTGNGPLVSHTYSQPGTYTVCLIFEDSMSSCLDTNCQTITVTNNSPCRANFNVLINGDTLEFINLSTGSPSQNYFWDFGDGSTSTSNSPIHVYQGPGTYNICLTASDSASGCQDTQCFAVTLGNSPNCQALFSYQANAGTVDFSNFSVGGSPASPLNYLWDFGDGDSSFQENPTHVYQAPGTYFVCLTVFDNSTGCFSDTCAIINITMGNPSCSALFSSMDFGNGLVQFFNSSGISYPSEFWDFGDGNTSNQANPIHQYNNPGPHVVTHAVSSSSGAGVCTDTFSTVIVVNTNGPGCLADFSVFYDSTAAGSLVFEATNPIPGYTYDWDLGDGTTASGPLVSHIYNITGSFNVCLAISDTSGCSDSICKVVPSQAPPAGFGVLGIVHLANGPATDFTAYLVVLDSAAGTLTAVDTFVSDPAFGPFFFFGAPNGDYRVKVALNPADPSHADYLPTYYGNDPFWYNATVVNQNSFPLLDIQMVPGTNSGGPGFIGGLISQGANRTTQNMVENISVMLLDANDQPVDYAMTNVSGEYTFQNIEEGTYKVLVDMWGKATEHYIVEISQGKTRVEDLNFEFNDQQIWKTGVATYLSSELEGTARVYPNPSDGFVNVDLEIAKAKNLRITLTNTLGQTLINRTETVQAGTSTIGMNLAMLPKGIYQIAISEDGKPLMTERILVK